MSDSHEQEIKQVPSNFLSIEELDQEIVSSRRKADAGDIGALVAGTAVVLTALKDPETATLLAETAAFAGSVIMGATSELQYERLKHYRNRRTYGVPQKLFEAATEKPTKAQRFKQLLKRLWEKDETDQIDSPSVKPPTSANPSAPPSVPKTLTRTERSEQASKPRPPAAQQRGVKQNEQPSVTPAVMSREKLDARRQSVSYLHSFFRVAQKASPNYRDQQRLITELGGAKRDPSAYPEGIYPEAEELYRYVTDEMLAPDGQKSRVLFNSSPGSHYSHNGLSVAIALYKLGFGGQSAEKQFETNERFDRNGIPHSGNC